MFKIFIISVGLIFGCQASQQILRLPAVVGQFYPSNKEALKKDIDLYLKKSNAPPDRAPSKIIGMIVPHAGYQYSGQTAAYAYRSLENQNFDVIVILGPYHSDSFPGVSVWAQGAWRTPLGEVSIEEALANNIRGETPDFLYDPQIHIVEHSLEVQIPFIQVVAPKAKIVPILISDPKFAKSLARALYKHLRNRSALVIASTDLSHYHPDSIARDMDKKAQDILQKLSPEIFREAYDKKEIELCGAAAVLTLLEFANLYGHAELTPLNYANSGDRTHDKSNVVGYNASLLTLSENMSSEQKDLLLNFARDTLYAYITNKTIPTLLINDPFLKEPRAVFVTLKDKNGHLRGCIGNLEAQEPLYLAVQHMTIEAATHDARFLPVTAQELKDLSIEISILDTPVQVKNADEIIYKTHGVILSQGKRNGVFLPEVANDFSTREDFLSELCTQKAGLSRDCWKKAETQINVFTTQTFSQ
ncbi:MAG: AmmeMemoRadiSam system protein B [Alphaproteobacteria bacterium]|nr:AmmeMemoRadiSam system protein B [Alphaproteobacteria bacterium]